jgi:hypothetical protein
MMLLALVGVLAAVAFMNRGTLGISGNPQGSTFAVGYTGR